MARKTVYTVAFSEDIWEKVTKENKRLMDDFLEYKKSSEKSNKTIKQYFQVLRLFFIWNYENNGNKFYIDVKKRDFIRFLSYQVSELNVSPNRVINIKAILSSFSNYIENVLDDEYKDYRNVIKKLETVDKVAVRAKTVLSEKEITDCLNELIKDGKEQVACFLALAAASGARKAELIQFKCDYFKDEYISYGSYYTTPEKIRTKGRGVRGKMIEKYVFVKQFKPYFDLWMKKREKLGINSEYLFVSKCSKDQYKQAAISNADNWAKIVSRYMNCDFYFHSLRHYLNTEMKKKNVPDHIIQSFFGWDSPVMSSIYNDSKASDDFGSYFNQDGIKENIKSGDITTM